MAVASICCAGRTASGGNGGAAAMDPALREALDGRARAEAALASAMVVRTLLMGHGSPVPQVLEHSPLDAANAVSCLLLT